ncbi:MAG: peptidoglycan DD-metalloendopeptidase family protein, partial [Anaerolineae bacterium]|nr:peptidoglycan DD-metalloendopeptidase family protein [Anaerolineae bacterium]
MTALLGRYGAHLAIVVVVVALGMAERITASPTTAAEDPGPFSAPAAAEPIATTTALPPATTGYVQPARQGITREAQPLTTIPERVRLDVIAYTVQEGDNIFLIAEAFGLSPYTVVWSNMEILQGAPWLLQPGLPLYIPPTDGAYHTVRAAESTADIATAYEVDATALYNLWNPIEPGEPLAEGTLLVIPGGIGPDFDWEPPPPPTAVPAPARPSTGVEAAVQAPVAPAASAAPNGWFVLPTGSYGVSGWVFGDYRNPTHIGLDYRCRLGDPIYAADGGTVVFAGWGGGYGNVVRVDHGNGFVTYYAHFSSFAAVAGQAV